MRFLAIFFVCLAIFFPHPKAKADIVFRDTTNTLVPEAAFVLLSDNPLSSTPSFHVVADSQRRLIDEVRVVIARSDRTPDYSNFVFTFAQATDVGLYRAEDFGFAIGTGQQYPFVEQTIFGIAPSEITSFDLQGFTVEELVFTGLQIYVDSYESIDLVFGATQIVPSDEGLAVLFSNDQGFDDRYDQGTKSGGLILNPDYPLPHSQFAVAIEGSVVPEANGWLVLFAATFLVGGRRRTC